MPDAPLEFFETANLTGSNATVGGAAAVTFEGWGPDEPGFRFAAVPVTTWTKVMGPEAVLTPQEVQSLLTDRSLLFSVIADPATVWASINTTEAKIDFLGLGETLTIDFRMTLTEGADTYSVPLVFTIHGANDVPTLGALSSGTVAETAGGTGFTSSLLTGTVGGRDPDRNDLLTYGIVGYADGDDGRNNRVTIAVTAQGTLTLNDLNRTYSFVPNAAYVESLDDGEVATASFTLSVSDGNGGFATQPLTIQFQGADERIAVTPVADQDALAGQSFSFAVPEETFTDAEGDALVWSASGLPSWLEFDPATRTFRGTPGGEEERVTVTVSVTEADGQDTASDSFDILIGRRIVGTKVADDLAGGQGGDLILARAGDDRLSGLGGDDRLLGEAGRDRLLGGDGDDVLAGGTGDDLHEGGTGADVFVFGRSGGADRVLDFDAAEGDRIALDGVVLRGWSERHVDGDAVLDTVLQLSSGTVTLLGTGNAVLDWHALVVADPLVA